MQILILYFSKGGNTKKLAEAIAEGVEGVEGVGAILKNADTVAKEDFINSEGIIAGSPVYFGVMAAELKKIFEHKAGLRFMVFHPSWGYFAHAYGLKQLPIEVEGKAPKPAQLIALIEHAREKGIHVVFVQPQFSAKSARLVAREIAGQVVFADPLAPDWMANLREVAARFEAALK